MPGTKENKYYPTMKLRWENRKHQDRKGHYSILQQYCENKQGDGKWIDIEIKNPMQWPE